MSVAPISQREAGHPFLPFASLVVAGTVLVAQPQNVWLAGAPLWHLGVWLALGVLVARITRSFSGSQYAMTLPFVTITAVEFGVLPAMLMEGLARWLADPKASLSDPARAQSACIGAGIASVCAGIALRSALGYGLLGAAAMVGLWAVLEGGIRLAANERRTLGASELPAILASSAVLISVGSTLAAAASHAQGVPLLSAVLVVPALALRQAHRGRSALLNQYYGTIAALSQMLQRAHPYTGGHVGRVASFAERTALALGLSQKRAQMVREAAVLHDIGKIAVDERILDKPEPLTDEEFAAVKRHSAYGEEIVGHVSEFRTMATWIRSHHERPDGRGYPDGLTGEAIPIESKIIAVADAFDAMTSDGEDEAGRAYRKAISEEAALAELDRCSGSQFDGQVVAAFREAVLGGAR